MPVLNSVQLFLPVSHFLLCIFPLFYFWLFIFPLVTCSPPNPWLCQESSCLICLVALSEIHFSWHVFPIWHLKWPPSLLLHPLPSLHYFLTLLSTSQVWLLAYNHPSLPFPSLNQVHLLILKCRSLFLQHTSILFQQLNLLLGMLNRLHQVVNPWFLMQWSQQLQVNHQWHSNSMSLVSSAATGAASPVLGALASVPFWLPLWLWQEYTFCWQPDPFLEWPWLFAFFSIHFSNWQKKQNTNNLHQKWVLLQFGSTKAKKTEMNFYSWKSFYFDFITPKNCEGFPFQKNCGFGTQPASCADGTSPLPRNAVYRVVASWNKHSQSTESYKEWYSTKINIIVGNSNDWKLLGINDNKWQKEKYILTVWVTIGMRKRSWWHGGGLDMCTNKPGDDTKATTTIPQSEDGENGWWHGLWGWWFLHRRGQHQ